MRLALALVLLLVAAPAAQARSAPCAPGGFSPTCRVWTGKVVFVDDGDTVDVDLDGDGGHTPRRVRITGIQAMEQTVYSSVVSRRRGACGALEATSRLERMLRAAHWRVRLTAQDPTKTSRGRLQRSVGARLGGRWVDMGEVLVREGRALWQPNYVEYAWNGAYRRASLAAARARVGLWDDDHCGAGPEAGARLGLEVNWDARGDDGVNVNGEWVDVVNHDPLTAVGLGGWWVRDTALRRFRLPDWARVPAGGTLRIYVGRGPDTAQALHWGLDAPAFENATYDERAIGDGAYLFDPQGDLRAGTVYPA